MYMCCIEIYLLAFESHLLTHDITCSLSSLQPSSSPTAGPSTTPSSSPSKAVSCVFFDGNHMSNLSNALTVYSTYFFIILSHSQRYAFLYHMQLIPTNCHDSFSSNLLIPSLSLHLACTLQPCTLQPCIHHPQSRSVHGMYIICN